MYSTKFTGDPASLSGGGVFYDFVETYRWISKS